MGIPEPVPVAAVVEVARVVVGCEVLTVVTVVGALDVVAVGVVVDLAVALVVAAEVASPGTHWA